MLIVICELGAGKFTISNPGIKALLSQDFEIEISQKFQCPRIPDPSMAIVTHTFIALSIMGLTVTMCCKGCYGGILLLDKYVIIICIVCSLINKLC
jgi:hypothetical protein